MAASLPTLDQMTGAWSGEYLSDRQPRATSEALNTLIAAHAVYELATRQIPQEVVDLSQEGNRATVDISMTQRWPDSSGVHADTSTMHYSQNLPVAEHDGYLHEGYERVQSFRGDGPSSKIAEDIASRHEYQQNADDSLLGSEQRELLTFPEGEADAVTITRQDMEGLQPPSFLSNNIIDFYIKYLERTSLSSEDRNRFYFFSSFFFTNLLGDSSASSNIDECKVDYEQVRKWSGGVNLFEKDYIFIPVLQSSHWSLIIICHLTGVSSSPDTRTVSPCVFHLDSVKGMHESFEGQVRSYILQAWMERYQAASNMDMLLALCQTKYVQAEVPQQNNGYDCGLYLLHYVEVFLIKSKSLNLSFALSKAGSHFTCPDFVGEVSVKRLAIEKLILELSRTSQEQAAKRMDIQNLTQKLRRIYEKLWIRLDGKVTVQWDISINSHSEPTAFSGGRIENVQSSGVSMFDAQGDEIKDAFRLSTGEIAVNNQHQFCFTETQHTIHGTAWELAVDAKGPRIGVEISHAEYQSAGEAATGRKQQPKKLPRAALLEPSKVTKKRKWTEDETSILLNCKVEGGRFCKENQTATRWDIISQEITNRLGTMPSGDQCRLRYDTLLKAYKTIKNHCMKSGTTFSEITDAQKLELKLATTLNEGWYKVIDEICHRWPHKTKSRKRIKLSPSDGNGLPSLSTSNPAPLSPPVPAPAPVAAPIISESAPIPTGSSKLDCSPQRQIAIPGFSTLDKGLRSTLVNLIQTLSTKCWSSRVCDLNGDPAVFDLERACRWLAIMQDRKPRDVRICIFRLLMLKHVNFGDYDDWVDGEPPCFKVSNLRVYKKFVEKVLCKHPHFDIYLEVRDDFDSVSFPKVPLSSAVQRIRVLSLYECEGLVHADLSYFPELRSLFIVRCEELKAVTGWEVVKELGWLEMRDCKSYVGFPPVQCLPSLREFGFVCDAPLGLERIPVLDFSQCVRLRRLEILGNNSSALNSVDLSTLRFLKVLTFSECEALTTIQGLSGLHSLTTLHLAGCKALRRVPELGCLKALTHLDMSWSGVDEIPGVQDLHLLTELFLWGCRSLKTLPWLGHLKALVWLDIAGSGVEEIPSVQDLVSLETLDCRGSRLKWLPELHHWPRLRWVSVYGTPLSTADPSSSYHGKRVLEFNSEEGRTGFDVEFSDISDTEDNLCADDSEEDWN